MSGTKAFDVTLVFGTGDRETVATIALQREAASPGEAIVATLDMLAMSPNGFTRDDVVQVVATRVEHDCAPNLLFQPGKPRQL